MLYNMPFVLIDAVERPEQVAKTLPQNLLSHHRQMPVPRVRIDPPQHIAPRKYVMRLPNRPQTLRQRLPVREQTLRIQRIPIVKLPRDGGEEEDERAGHG